MPWIPTGLGILSEPQRNDKSKSSNGVDTIRTFAVYETVGMRLEKKRNSAKDRHKNVWGDIMRGLLYACASLMRSESVRQEIRLRKLLPSQTHIISMTRMVIMKADIDAPMVNWQCIAKQGIIDRQSSQFDRCRVPLASVIVHVLSCRICI